ncbi:hypothetical protein TNMX_00390 [Thermus sp. NMX2.A1]|nr:hypothetical protein TNMX_00390 [Thermus sp. NMX2.A1]
MLAKARRFPTWQAFSIGQTAACLASCWAEVSKPIQRAEPPNAPT